MSKYLDTTNELVKGLNSLAENFKITSFIKWGFTILVIGAIALFIYESFFSSSFYYNKIDRKLIIIEDVIRISNGDSLIVAESKDHLLSILDSLEPPENKSISGIHIEKIFSESLLNILIKIAGTLIFPLLIIFSVRNDPNKTETITGAVIMIVAFAILSVFIPIIYSVWVNFVIMPIFQILVLLPFIASGKNQ